jgi:hypothetical protein
MRNRQIVAAVRGGARRIGDLLKAIYPTFPCHSSAARMVLKAHRISRSRGVVQVRRGPLVTVRPPNLLLRVQAQAPTGRRASSAIWLSARRNLRCGGRFAQIVNAVQGGRAHGHRNLGIAGNADGDFVASAQERRRAALICPSASEGLRLTTSARLPPFASTN